MSTVISGTGFLALFLVLFRGNLLVLAPVLALWLCTVAWEGCSNPSSSSRKSNYKGCPYPRTVPKRRIRLGVLIVGLCSWTMALLAGWNRIDAEVCDDAQVANQMTQAERFAIEGNFEQALAAFKGINTGGSLPPRQAQKHHNLGVCCMRLERWEEAEAAFKEAVRNDPEDFEAYYNLGRLAARRQGWETGAQYLESAVNLQPQHAGALCLSAECYLASGKFEKALEAANRAEASVGTDERLRTSIKSLKTRIQQRASLSP